MCPCVSVCVLPCIIPCMNLCVVKIHSRIQRSIHCHAHLIDRVQVLLCVYVCVSMCVSVYVCLYVCENLCRVYVCQCVCVCMCVRACVRSKKDFYFSTQLSLSSIKAHSLVCTISHVHLLKTFCSKLFCACCNLANYIQFPCPMFQSSSSRCQPILRFAWILNYLPQ